MPCPWHPPSFLFHFPLLPVCHSLSSFSFTHTLSHHRLFTHNILAKQIRNNVFPGPTATQHILCRKSPSPP
ncbi:MAG: hypothetical protein J3Q66DRAFT_335264 [Benniella sp.]|nr:MAG: hypothetical protein J3Q66DRAFT_335264 [Benniella sp.]